MENKYCDDKIWLAFDGELGVLQEQKARDRMAWIVNNAKGKTAIDIGCSQGITSVLLGRNGFHVLGLDIDPNTISFAKERLAEENGETQKNVTFALEDFLIGYNNETDHYDTIIMTEILEHLTNPDLFIKKAVSILEKDGVMLITVPFAINEHPDHKQTFYGESAVRLIGKHASVLSIEFFKGWIGIIAAHRQEKETSEIDWHKVIVEEENGFYLMERDLRDSNKKLKARSEKLSEQLEASQSNNEELKNQLENAKAENTQLGETKRELEARFEKAQIENTQLREAKRELKARLEKAETENNKLGEVSQKLMARAKLAETNVQETKEQYRILEEQKKAFSKANKKYKERIETLTEQKERLISQKQTLQKELTPLGIIKRGIRKIPFAVPIARLLKGDKNGAKQYFVEKKALRHKKQQGENGSREETKQPEDSINETSVSYPVKKGTITSAKESPVAAQKASGEEKAPKALKTVNPSPKTANNETGSQKAAVIVRKEEKPKEKNNGSETPVEYDMGYFDRIKDLVVQIPVSNGTRYYQKHSGKIGWLVEQFRYDAFSSAIDGIVLTPDNWQESIEHIDFLLVTSGWGGVNNAWPGFGKPASEIRQIIYQVIEACKEKGIPTVFYSVEDPPNYLVFIEIAKRCDYVFTAAEEVIPQYKEDCGHDRVYNLKIAMNPLLHNPVGMRKVDRSDRVLFAGSWMPKYPERIEDTRMLIDGVRKASRALRIIDRNLLRPEVKYRFPAEYAEYVAPPVDHETLQKIHKMYDWGLTLNSVKRSKTMFANRAYEMLALGNLIISDDCTGIKTQLPTAFTCESSEKVERILETMTPEEAYEREIAGLRFVLQKDTCFDRMKTLLDTIGRPSESNNRKVAVVINSDQPAGNDAFIRQTYQNKTALTPNEWLMRADEFDAVAFMDKKFYYGDFYLEDMVNGFKYTDSDYITKASYYQNGVLHSGPEHDYVSVMPDKYRTVFWKGALSPERLIHLEGSLELPNGYSIDHFEFDADYHPIKKNTEEKKLTVILPAKNNGWFLYGKAFSSLRRNPLFDQMSILCIDGGSTDNSNTIGLLHMLERRYPNVKLLSQRESGASSLTDAIMKALMQAISGWAAILPAEAEAEQTLYQELLELAAKAEQKPVIFLSEQEQNIGAALFRTEKLNMEFIQWQRKIIEKSF